MAGCYGGLAFCGTPGGNINVVDTIVELFGDIGEQYYQGTDTSAYHGYNYGYLADKNTTYNNNTNYIALVKGTSGPNTNHAIRTYYTSRDNDVAGNLVTGSYLVRASVVPLPATIWLFSSGLLGLVGLSRRRKTA